MTTFSRIFINPQRRGGRKLLTSRQAMHAAVRAAFPPDLAKNTGRILWRVDSEARRHTLYIVAPERPDLSHLVEQAGWSTRPGDIVDYTRMLDSVRAGAEFRFRFTGNPVHRTATEGGKRGQLHPHVTPAQQVAWLTSKGESNGFALRSTGSDDTVSSTIVSRREDARFARGHGSARSTVTLRIAQFDGSLTVTDALAMRHALTHGIGRGKAYGCGLMTLASERPD